MKLPPHVVEKKIACIDADGNEVNPEEPNGYKYETLILDMIKLLDSCLAYEVVREKNLHLSRIKPEWIRLKVQENFLRKTELNYNLTGCLSC